MVYCGETICPLRQTSLVALGGRSVALPVVRGNVLEAERRRDSRTATAGPLLGPARGSRRAARNPRGACGADSDPRVLARVGNGRPRRWRLRVRLA